MEKISSETARKCKSKRRMLSRLYLLDLVAIDQEDFLLLESGLKVDDLYTEKPSSRDSMCCSECGR